MPAKENGRKIIVIAFITKDMQRQLREEKKEELKKLARKEKDSKRDQVGCGRGTYPAGKL